MSDEYRDLSALEFIDAPPQATEIELIDELLEALNRVQTIAAILETRYYRARGKEGPL